MLDKLKKLRVDLKTFTTLDGNPVTDQLITAFIEVCFSRFTRYVELGHIETDLEAEAFSKRFAKAGRIRPSAQYTTKRFGADEEIKHEIGSKRSLV